jgi:hypothetical protein
MSLDYTITIPKSLFVNFSTPSIPLNSSIISSTLSIGSSVPASSYTASSKLSCFNVLYHFLNDLISKIHFYFHSRFYPGVKLTTSAEELTKAYFGLGEQKWRECIDGAYHDKGKFVFDQGLHGGTTEPGFVGSMENAFNFVAPFLSRKIDSAWFLQLHKRTCGHFNGDPNIYLMGQERVGVFRHRDVGATFSGVYQVTPEALQEFNALDQHLKNLFGDSYGLGTFQDLGQGSKFLHYKSMTEEQVATIFNYFLYNFYNEVEGAINSDEKLLAIARLHQRLEWLHPVLDGTSRTDIALMNKNLTDYGFHPAILEHPHVSSSYGLKQWVKYLKKGLVKWEQLRDSL